MLIYTNYFGIISEGQTDFPVLKNILIGLFYRYDREIAQLITQIRPLPGKPFGWQKVLNYCQTGEIEQALQSNQYIIIQLDTDIAPQMGIDITALKSQDTFHQNVLDDFREKVIESLTPERYQRYQERIFFAICMDSVECWLLPFYSNDPKIYSKTSNCLYALETEIQKDKAFSKIKLESKQVSDYEKIAAKCSGQKNRQLKNIFERNYSLKIFVDSLIERVQIEPPPTEVW